MMSEFLLYFSSAGLSMNPDKSEVIMFRSSNATKTMDVKVGEQLESESVKLLGVTVQQNYRFQKHARNVSNSVNYKLSRLGKVLPHLERRTGKMILESLIHSTINYLLEVWGGAKTVQIKVQKSLNNALRLLTGSTMRTNVERLMSQEAWLNVPNMYRFAVVQAMRRLLKTRKPMHCWMTVCERPAVPIERDLRDRGMTFAWFPMSEKARSSFLRTGKTLMNSHRFAQRLFAGDEDEIKAEIKITLVTKNGNPNI